MYIQRAIEPALLKISETFPVLLLVGPRQVGKSTVLKHLSHSDRQYVSLDDPDIRLLAKTEPALFFQRYTLPILIDEVQYAPELLPYIKLMVDKDPRNGRIWLTGSQTIHLMKEASESLAGRVGISELLGFSAAELSANASVRFTTDTNQLLARRAQVKSQTVHEVFKHIFLGSMPRLNTQPETDWETFYRSYVDTYIKRDIRTLAQIDNEMTFYRFLTVVAARTAKPLIYNEIADELGISAPTVKRWISLLVSSHIISVVEPYHNNILKRVTKTPILHFLDTGMCAYLLKWTSSETLEMGAMSGQFFESYVYSEIYKSYINDGKIPPLYYYRDKDQKEIDLILYVDGILRPIEIKKTASPTLAHCRHFSVLSALSSDSTHVSVGQGSVICMASDLLPLNSQIWAVPVWMI